PKRLSWRLTHARTTAFKLRPTTTSARRFRELSAAPTARQFPSKHCRGLRGRRWIRLHQKRSLSKRIGLAKAMSSSILLTIRDGFRRLTANSWTGFSRHSIAWGRLEVRLRWLE